jgi:hypothetical protein
MHNLGYLTDCILHKIHGVVEEKKDYFLIRTPSNPTYFWGNLIVFKSAPVAGCFDE